jgi:hypothetical protein
VPPGRHPYYMIKKPKPVHLLLSVVILGSCLLYAGAFRFDKFGFYRDDSMYVVMARSLATGAGYRIMSLPNEPVQAKSPPFYPLLLSLIWRADSRFPDNVGWMAVLSMAATLGFIALTWRYLVNQNYATQLEALVVVSLVGLNWRTAVLGSGVYSEMIYAALSITGLYFAEECERRRRTWLMGAVGGLIVGSAFLTRSAGIALLLAMACYYPIRRFRGGVVPVATAALVMLSWFAWGRLSSHTGSDVNAGFYESYLTTFTQLLGDQRTHDAIGLLRVIVGIVVTNAIGLILISVPIVCLALTYGVVAKFSVGFLFVAAAVLWLVAGGFIRQVRRRLRLMHAYVVWYVVVHLFWPYSSYDRFLMPILPFLLLFAVVEVVALSGSVREGLKSQAPLARRVSGATIAIALVIPGAVAAYGYVSGLRDVVSRGSIRKTAGPSSDDKEVIDWIKDNTRASDVLICYRDPLYYLYTGRKSARSTLSREGGLLDEKKSGEERSRAFFRIIDDNGGNYIVLTPSDFDLESEPEAQREGLKEFVEQHPERFVLAFRSSDGNSTIYRIEKNSR